MPAGPQDVGELTQGNVLLKRTEIGSVGEEAGRCIFHDVCETGQVKA